MPKFRPGGMLGFTIVWFGQVISLIGSAMSGFAMTIWAWQLTGTATALALVGLFWVAPNILFSPIAGALVDRSNRKLVMMVSDLASGLITVIYMLMMSAGQLQIWHLYVGGFIAGTFQAFQWPAYSSAITMMIPKQQYGRATGMMSLAEWGSGVFSPVLAAALLAPIGVPGILTIDIITFVIAILALLWIEVPQPPVSEEGKAAKGNLWQESLYGFKFILARPSMLGLQLVFFFGNLMSTIGGTLISPMILSRTDNNALLLGSIESVGSIGGILGSLLITAWGGPKKKVMGVLLGWGLSGLLHFTAMGLGREGLLWAVGAFFGSFFGPIINSSNQAIWMSKVAPDIQGRVFSVRRLIAQITAPVGMALAGPLADQLFEPAMATSTSALGAPLGWLTGTGPGTGMSLILLLCGVFTVIAILVAYANPDIRNVETIIPDHNASETTPAAAPAE